jgi:hypothetical protein
VCDAHRVPFAGEPAADSPNLARIAIDYLDWLGQVALRRLDGLAAEDQIRPAVPSGWSALGLVKHLASTTRYWVRYVLEGEAVDFSWPGSPELEWSIQPDDSTDSIIKYFRREHMHAIAVLRRREPEAVAAREFGTGVRPTTAWVTLHLLQESARHCGHLDIGRELLDGATELD